MNPEEGHRLHWSSMLAQFVQVMKSTFLIWIGLFSAFKNPEHAWVPFVGIGAIVVLMSVFLVVRWRRYRYFLLQDEIYAIGGGLFKTETHIPYEKIQTVDANSSIVHRLFGLTRLRIKTASKGTQIDLTSIAKEEAQRVRQTIEARRGEAVGAAAGPGANPQGEAATLRKLATTEIVVAAATSRQFLVSIGVVSYLYGELSEALALNVFKDAIDAAQTENGFEWTMLDPILILGVIGILLVAWLGTIAYTVLVFKSYGIGRRGDTLTIQRGFTNIQSTEVPVFRVQSVEIKQTPLQLLLGFGELQIRVIGHAEEKQQNTVLHPCLAKKEWPSFLREFVPGFEISETTVRAPGRALARFILRGVRKPLIFAVPLALFVGISFSTWGAAAVALLLVPFLSIGLLIGLVNYNVESIGYGDTHATFMLQDWTRVIGVVRRDAFQQYIVKQNWFQRRLNIVTFGVQVASGAVGVKHFVHDLDSDESDRFAAWLRGKPASQTAIAAAP